MSLSNKLSALLFSTISLLLIVMPLIAIASNIWNGIYTINIYYNGPTVYNGCTLKQILVCIYAYNGSTYKFITSVPLQLYNGGRSSTITCVLPVVYGYVILEINWVYYIFYPGGVNLVFDSTCYIVPSNQGTIYIQIPPPSGWP